jgi:hypothetical protein
MLFNETPSLSKGTSISLESLEEREERKLSPLPYRNLVSKFSNFPIPALDQLN